MVYMVEEVVGFIVAECSLETLTKYFEQRPNDALEHIRSTQGVQKGGSISSFGSFSSYCHRLFLSVSFVERILSCSYYIDYFFQLAQLNYILSFVLSFFIRIKRTFFIFEKIKYYFYKCYK